MSRRRLLVWLRYCTLAVVASWITCNWWITAELARVDRNLATIRPSESDPGSI